jgi:hypothetical protein
MLSVAGDGRRRGTLDSAGVHILIPHFVFCFVPDAEFSRLDVNSHSSF